jgi:hypothetical protein
LQARYNSNFKTSRHILKRQLSILLYTWSRDYAETKARNRLSREVFSAGGPQEQLAKGEGIKGQAIFDIESGRYLLNTVL